MKPYVIRQGDYLRKLAHALGFDADGVWSHPKNADVKKQRDPNLLHPGDILYVPNPRRSGTSWQRKDEFLAVNVPKTKIQLALKKKFANEPYEIEGLGAPQREPRMGMASSR